MGDETIGSMAGEVGEVEEVEGDMGDHKAGHSGRGRPRMGMVNG